MDSSSNYSKLNKIKDFHKIVAILRILKKHRLLRYIQYNKKLQNLLYITINDYKEAFYKIEIEVTPKINKTGKFINIPKENETYFHIYFNGYQETIKNKIAKEDKVRNINIIIDKEITSIDGLFREIKCLKKIDFISFNRNDIENLSYMFKGYSSLEEINISNFITDNVIDMSYMFNNCSSLKEINLSNFNT